jgi:ABC-type branched-subunit amino acid transport system permease subunit
MNYLLCFLIDFDIYAIVAVSLILLIGYGGQLQVARTGRNVNLSRYST